MLCSLSSVTGCAGVLVGHPLDTVKVHMQTQNHLNPMYRNTWHCLTKIAKQESFRGLYRGMSSPMAGVAAVNAIAFGVYGNVQRLSGDPNGLMSPFLAGSAAGLCQSLICSPMELIKTRLQLQHTNAAATQFQNPFQCLSQIWRTERLRGVFRGLGITAARDVPGFSSYFVCYEIMTRNTPNPTALHTLMAGGMAGTLSWVLTFPVDIIKSQLQADGMAAGQNKYNGTWDCARKGYREEGMRFFTRGLTSTLFRAFPMNAACFLVVSWTLKLAQQAESTSLKVDYHHPEPMAVIGAISAPILLPHGKHNDYHRSAQHKTHTIRHFIFSSVAFHEAVCQDELSELAHDVYNDETSYYRWVVDTTTDPEGKQWNEFQRRLLTDWAKTFLFI